MLLLLNILLKIIWAISCKTTVGGPCLLRNVNEVSARRDKLNKIIKHTNIFSECKRESCCFNSALPDFILVKSEFFYILSKKAGLFRQNRVNKKNNKGLKLWYDKILIKRLIKIKR